MLGPYRQILALPGALTFSLTGLLARFPNSMLGIGIILMLSGLYDSYAVAGRVSACSMIALAVCGPQLAKLVDRHGQARVMRPALTISALSLLALVLTARAQGPEWALYPSALLAGATLGSMGSLVRARWSRTVRTPGELHTAFSLESALDELGFILGPVIATALATSVVPSAGVLLAVVLMVAGGFTFLGQRASEPPPSPRTEGSARDGSLLRSPAIIGVLAIFLCAGSLFGASDVATVAFAEELGVPGAAGPVLGIFAAGSFVAGLVYGSRNWTRPLWWRMVVGILPLVGATCLVLVVDSIVALAVVLFVAGLGIAPTIINGNGLVQQVVSPRRLTEGLTWVSTALNLGVAAGSSLGGQLIDVHGSRGGWVVVVASGVLALVAALAAMPTTRRAAGDGVAVSPGEHIE